MSRSKARCEGCQRGSLGGGSAGGEAREHHGKLLRQVSWRAGRWAGKLPRAGEAGGRRSCWLGEGRRAGEWAGERARRIFGPLATDGLQAGNLWTPEARCEACQQGSSGGRRVGAGG